VSHDGIRKKRLRQPADDTAVDAQPAFSLQTASILINRFPDSGVLVTTVDKSDPLVFANEQRPLSSY
jgi:hypothetical protein